MKKTLLNSFISLYLAACGSLHAADPDLVKGVDFTGASSFAPSQLNQLVDNAYVGPYRGMIIYTNSEPIASVITKYQRYLWLDTRTALPTPKVWNTNGYWTNIVAIAVIADYSVTTDKIATNAVTTIKIADNAVTDAKIQDATITGTKIGTGTITSTNIAVGTITSANIGNLQVGSANIAAAAITGDKIAANSIGTYMLTNGFALAGSNVARGTITSVNIGQNAIAVTNLATNSITSTYIASGTLPVATNIASIALPAAGTNTIVTHSLAGTPSVVRVVLRCGVGGDANSAYVEGDEIGIDKAWDVSGSFYSMFSVSSTATTVTITRYNAGGALVLLKKDTGAYVTVSAPGNFTLKVYLVYIP